MMVSWMNPTHIFFPSLAGYRDYLKCHPNYDDGIDRNDNGGENK
jgi:hypothetical protein